MKARNFVCIPGSKRAEGHLRYHIIPFLLTSVLSVFMCLQASGENVKPDSAYLTTKSIQAVRITTIPDMDGSVEEDIWKSLPVATDFVEYVPHNGNYPPFRTEVRFAYDDQALYIGAIMFDPYPDSICHELGKRDQIEQLNTDYISFDILPYNDDINMYEFKISPAGLQNDCKYTAVGQDVTWDVVWESAATINDSSWQAELRIPWAALRFPVSDKQIWGINMWRNLARRQEFSTWTFVSNQTNDIFKYYGELIGIENIDPPLRLSFSPYLAGYVENDTLSNKWSYFTRGGLDLKYGINQSYTLDMMMIPDFGQVQSDDQVLNLTPFEIRYDEKRQFFTEATELFDKCGIFYSRRIGSEPRNYYNSYIALNDNERIKKNPSETRILNATKISGRDIYGLGVGVFNAMTTPAYAEIEDTITGNTRKILTQAFTNYNVAVLDQNLPNNSYVTLINTNYLTPSDGYLANVTGTESRLCNRQNTFAFFGRMNVSIKNKTITKKGSGFNYLISLSKPSGKWQYGVSRNEINRNYDPNDMGFLTRNNLTENTITISHNIFNPVWKIRQSGTEFEILYSSLSNPQSYTHLRLQLSNRTTFNNLFTSYFEAGYQPKGYHDYYEPRIWGWFYKIPEFIDLNWQFTTDNRKKLRFNNNFSFVHCNGNNNNYYQASISPRYRFSDRITITLSSTYEKNINDHGWVNTEIDETNKPLIYFGRRNLNIVTNIINAKYIFDTRSSVTLRVRHYWSEAKYRQFFMLNESGRFNATSYTANHDLNLNLYNMELQYVWYFAPGSELSLMWKKAFTRYDGLIRENYWENLSYTLGNQQLNSISFRILYYLNYQSLKKRK